MEKWTPRDGDAFLTKDGVRRDHLQELALGLVTFSPTNPVCRLKILGSTVHCVGHAQGGV